MGCGLSKSSEPDPYASMAQSGFLQYTGASRGQNHHAVGMGGAGYTGDNAGGYSGGPGDGGFIMPSSGGIVGGGGGGAGGGGC